jgi:methylenetetrahydrofolate--tRNA-(uracil-5-)-methyltransferase
MGILAGINAARLVLGREPVVPPGESAMGSLIRYITDRTIKNFQPMNINFGLFPPLEGRVRKSEKKPLIAARALESVSRFKPFL